MSRTSVAVFALCGLVLLWAPGSSHGAEIISPEPGQAPGAAATPTGALTKGGRSLMPPEPPDPEDTLGPELKGGTGGLVGEERRKALLRRPGEKRPEEQLTVDIFGRPLTIGGEYRIRTRFDGNRRLDKKTKNDRVRLDHSLQLELFYPFTDSFSIFLEGVAGYSMDLYSEDGHRRTDKDLARGETWLYAGNLFDTPFSLQVGRQSFDDRREWWWDESLDAIRLHFDLEFLHIEFAIAELLTQISTEETDIDPEEENVLRLLGQATLRLARKHRLELYFLSQHDNSHTEREDDFIEKSREDESDADLTWYGARLIGSFKLGSAGKLYYWIDTALVDGEEVFIDFDDVDFDFNTRVADVATKHDVEGWAADAGFTWATNLPLRPAFSLGYAIGSGDHDATKEDDHSFRQTGLQDNNARFRGVDRFRYYGEFLRPELSNLQVGTAALGFPLLTSSSLEVLYHIYNQVHPAPFLRDTRLRTSPLGLNRFIGHELDVVLGVEEWPHLEIELVGSAFQSESAFGPKDGEMSYLGTFQVDVNF